MAQAAPLSLHNLNGLDPKGMMRTNRPASILAAPHTPEHIAAVFAPAITQAQSWLQTQPHAPVDTQSDDVHFMLCAHLPETLSPTMHYLLLGQTLPKEAKNPYWHIQLIKTPVSLHALTQQIVQYISAAPHVFLLGHQWLLAPHRRSLLHPNAAAISLTELETRLLSHLAAHQEQTITREALMRAVWDYDNAVESHTLETHLYRLRQKLEAVTPSVCKIHSENNRFTLLIDPD